MLTIQLYSGVMLTADSQLCTSTIPRTDPIVPKRGVNALRAIEPGQRTQPGHLVTSLTADAVIITHCVPTRLSLIQTLAIASWNRDVGTLVAGSHRLLHTVIQILCN